MSQAVVNMPRTKGSVPVVSAEKPAARVVSLDALRGFDMFWIIGGRELFLAAAMLLPPSYAHLSQEAKRQLEHSSWEGFTAYDLIMPLFLFVVGAAMPFSFSRRWELGQSKLGMYAKIFRRTIILFVVGMAVQGHLLDFKLSTLHVFANTLQAIAVGYFVAGILLLHFPIWAQAASAVMLMVAYWILLRYVPFTYFTGGYVDASFGPMIAYAPVFGHGAGLLEPHANFALAVDQRVLGRFIDGTNPPYTWVLSGLTFAASVLLGVFAGHLLRSRLSALARFVWLVVLGAGCLAAGWAWSEWGGFPIIKHIWTSSMTLWAAGWSYLLLAAFYLVIDVVGLRFLAFPFTVIGMNAITIYVAYHFVPFNTIANNLVGGLSRHLGAAGPFAVWLTTVLIVWLLLYHMYRRKIFLRI
jgi:predicted acyltransferase